jgi:hypothetical protein
MFFALPFYKEYKANTSEASGKEESLYQVKSSYPPFLGLPYSCFSLRPHMLNPGFPTYLRITHTGLPLTIVWQKELFGASAQTLSCLMPD